MVASNPFPEATAVQRMVQFYDLLATPQERIWGQQHGMSTELYVRASLLGQVLAAARQYQGWSDREVAEWLGRRRDDIYAIEIGVIDEPGLVRRYAELLGAEDLLAQWVERNQEAAEELGLVFTAPATLPLFPNLPPSRARAPRPRQPHPYRIPPGFFAIPTEAELAALAAEAEARDRQGRLVF